MTGYKLQFGRNYEGEHAKLPRKTKKLIEGVKLSKSKLNKMILNKDKKLYGICPKCGKSSFRDTGNMTTYPEEWSQMFCRSCDLMIAFSDNGLYGNLVDEIMAGNITSWKELEDIEA
jgi:hypothetical protein